MSGARTVWVVGNWKQNLLREPAAALARAVADGLAATTPNPRLRVGIAPTYLSLDAVRPFAQDGTSPRLLAQDVAGQSGGTFTGEVGAAMLREAGVKAAIVGHSERRALFGDHDALVASKVESALDGGLDVVVCVGEQLVQRDAGTHESVVISQLSQAFSRVSNSIAVDRVLVAYEPVWAIGTGRTATPAQASSMHATIRAWLRNEGFSGDDRSVLYGGSVKPDNATELLGAGDIDGFLVGGASLDAGSFLAIVRAASAFLSP